MTMHRLSPRILAFVAAICLALSVYARPKTYRVVMQTTMGDIEIVLFNDTPRHRDNFVKLVREGYYDGLLFHRVIKDFMIQSGDPDSRQARPGQLLGEGGPDYTIPIEIDLPYHYHYRGALAAAREPDEDNPTRSSSGSQFYIVWGKKQTTAELEKARNYVYDMTGGAADFSQEMAQVYRTEGGAPHLDGQYTVFGRVKAGLKVVKAIQAVETDANDRPLEDIRIVRAYVVNP